MAYQGACEERGGGGGEGFWLEASDVQLLQHARVVVDSACRNDVHVPWEFLLPRESLNAPFQADRPVNGRQLVLWCNVLRSSPMRADSHPGHRKRESTFSTSQ